MQKLTLDTFTARAIRIHGEKYDYSKSIYTNSQIKIEIGCPTHGSFFQTPNNHNVQKQECPKCVTEKKASDQRMSTCDFINRAISIHADFYNYSRSKYKQFHSKLEIVCPMHGSFWQEAGVHLMGGGCPSCKNKKIGDRKRKSLIQFIRDATKVHGDRYDYSKFDYYRSHKTGKIVCHKHGIFLQSPTNHLSGNGCPKCGYNISDPEVNFLDYIKLPEEHRHKYIKPYKVDGYDPITNTIYEFLGDYWHGNPIIFDMDRTHPKTKITFGAMFENTMSRLKKLKSIGYTVKYVWENDWNNYKKGKDVELKLQLL